MQQIGLIIATEEGVAQVKVVQHSACASCHHKCGLAHEIKDLQVSARNNIGAQPGEEVILEMCHTAVLRAAVWAYIFPLLFLFTGVVLGAVVWDNELLGVVLGVLMLAASYFLIKLVLEPRLKERGQYQLAIVGRADKLECAGRKE